MSDLSAFVFSGVWIAWSDRMVFGNNGPAIGVPVLHYTNRCTTFNAHAHQKFRFATMTGMLNGVSVHSYTGFDFGASIFYNHFSYLEISHGGPGCP